MEHVEGMSVADTYGEEDEKTPTAVYQQIRMLMKQVAAAGISYPDITGYNVIESSGGRGLVLVDFEHSKCEEPDEFMRAFLAGHDGWNPEYR